MAERYQARREYNCIYSNAIDAESIGKLIKKMGKLGNYHIITAANTAENSRLIKLAESGKF